MTRVLLDQSIHGRSRATRTRASSGRSISSYRPATGRSRYRRLSPEERLERRETFKTYLLGLLLIALVTTAIVVVPVLRGDAEVPGDAGLAGDAEVTGNAEVPGDAGLADVDSATDDTTETAENPGDAALPQFDLASAGDITFEQAVVETEPEMPAVTFERSEPEEYLVENGETLSEIAAMYDLEWSYLAEFNDLSDPDRLKPGQRIMIPAERDRLLQSEQP